MMKKTGSALRGLAFGVSLIALGAPLAAQVQADPAATPTPAAGEPSAGMTTEQAADVIVTGSRIARSTFQTPTPVTVIGEQQLQQKAATNVVDLLRDIPALRPNRVNGSGRNIGLSVFNMRSLGSPRTLLLIDGQRVLDSSPVAGGFDINVIPAPLVSRIDIVTAGASSVYGSDAITGVVNVVLNDTIQGVRLDGQYNVSTHGDLDQYSLSGIYGGKFGGGRGRFVVAASYFETPDIVYQGARDWGRRGVTLVPNAAYTPTNGQFRQLIQENSRFSQMTAGGVITTPGPLRNIQFGQNGAQSLFQQGTNVGTVWMQGGDGLMPQPDFGIIQVASRQFSGFGRVNYELTDDIEARVDVLASTSKARSTNNYNYNNGDITIRRDNAFLPANILAAMIANNYQTIRIGRYNPETGINTNTTENDYYRVGAGLKGSFSDVWKWEIGGSYTYAKSVNLGRSNRNNINWNLALDSVIGPNGQPVCRSTLTNPGNGCVPANVFGLNALSPEVVAYVTGTSKQDSRSQSGILNANVSGDLFDTWAGAVKVAVGAEYRRDTVDSDSDPISDISGWRQGTFGSYNGKLEVKEIYGEASIPLAADTSFARSLDLDLAGRYVDYSTVGSTEVWKVGLNWALNDSIRLRSTYSRDFRAPKINDLFAQANLRAGNTVIDYVDNRAANVNLLVGGNPNLGPETAYTFSGGIVLQPAFAPRLQLSADFFDIDLRDALVTPGAQEVVDRCGRGDQTFCAGIIRDPSTNLITQVNAVSFNAQTLKTRGIDFELSYSFPLFQGDFNFRTVATYTDRLIATTASGEVDTAGQLQGTYATPKWRGSTTLAFEQGPFNARVLFNLIGGGKYDNNYGPLDISRNKYPAYLYTDVSVQYDLTENLQIYAKVENLTDTDPPLLADSTITVASATLSQFHDLRGRVVGVGARLRF
jgi:outer membrane receptor protein involved in Fe transport